MEIIGQADNLGGRLRSFRRMEKLTGVQLSKIIGISQGSLSDIETNKTTPSTKTLEGLIRNTDINIEWLITGEGAIKRKSQLDSKPVTKRKFDILDETEEWLSEEVRKNPKNEIWFEVQMEKCFSGFKEWKRKRDDQESGEYRSGNRQVA